ncbi:thaumatin [Pilobolus umbonatus]|nr:thaumatin [Pilobolus umbonatus]
MYKVRFKYRSVFKNRRCLLVGYTIGVSALKRTTVEVVNNCPKPIELGQLKNEDIISLSVPIEVGKSVSYTYEGTWSGRFWARDNCQGAECQIAGSAYPASLAEFTFHEEDINDFYDISFVDGYNLPLKITPMHADDESVTHKKSKYWCGTPSCTITPSCPRKMQKRVDGTIVGCQSSCSRFGNLEYCCLGPFSGPLKCVMNTYAKLIKKACPDVYTYAYDDITSLYQCDASKYIITFCP